MIVLSIFVVLGSYAGPKRVNVTVTVGVRVRVRVSVRVKIGASKELTTFFLHNPSPLVALGNGLPRS